ncbi:FAD-dependent oxidoreductase [Actinotalea sp. M2MS4P-6]|uniref:FAD-dependent oxidoreductase n=1 Tax=Actinotalea sp. M2MS4P-6 TaxID=2983762 RepID=UPI0021E488BA|nr:FAD-dependent oxidoreductase [Actinotalea sp. M2MS4P-6]MCV2394756.1 FAD-dependent oxidoreductase [Actinotalea sp. M2MS4P-6]
MVQEWQNIEPMASYDVVVVGGGGSGHSAALRAARNGLSVAVLEKEPAIGGNSQFAEGVGAIQTSLQKEQGLDQLSREEAFQILVDYSHYFANPEVVAAFINNSATTVDIFRDLGVPFHMITSFDPDSEYKVWHLVKGGVGVAVQIMHEAALKAGVDFFTSTRARHLVKDGDKVSGVVAEAEDGELIRLEAGAVIIASGGYTSNEEMRKKYVTMYDPNNAYPNDPSNNQGDGILMTFEAGGDSFGLGMLMLNGAWVRGKSLGSHLNCASTQPYLWVNLDGRRFTTETAVQEFQNAGNILSRQPEGVQFTILDQTIIDHLVNDGCEVGIGAYVLSGEKLTRLEAEIEEDLVDGIHVWKADTIEELAAKMGVNVDVFTREVAEYNEACHAGKDAKFFKPKYLFPIETGPFYAIKGHNGFVCSQGGIRINGKMEVLDKGSFPIPGLYAVGVDAGGMYGDTYPARLAGVSCGFAMTSGWMAADAATKALRDAPVTV